MAYVQPSGIIELFKGINLDNRYMHTLYFATRAKQKAFFDALVDNTLRYTQQYYTRTNVKVLRLKVNAEVVQNVTYMRFTNNRNNSTDKYYYCFVTAVNYINEGVTEIVYEIDVMQTWFFQGGAIQPCMVIREHVTDDTFTHHLEPEPIGSDVYDLDELATDNNVMNTYFGGYNMVLNTSAKPKSTEILKDGIVNGTKFTAINAASSAATVIQTMEDQLGGWDDNEQSAKIVDMFMFPRYFSGETDQYGDTHDAHSNGQCVIHHPKRYDSYVPVNKKLFGYPFSYLYVTTCDGDAGQYRWEYFDGDVTSPSETGVRFDINACCTGGGIIEMHPKDYNGVTDAYDSKLVMNNFPKCSWAYDAYQAWIASGGQTKALYAASIAQEKGTISHRQIMFNAAMNATQQGIEMTDKYLKKEFVGAAQVGVQAVGTAGNAMFQHEMLEVNLDEALHKIAFEFADAAYQPNTVVGSAMPNIAVGKQFLSFRFFNAHVRDTEMVKLDNFLSMYGYAINDVKTPNLTGRAHWNFVKTKDSVITGNMPATSKAAIGRIFDGGIFFWKADENNAAASNSKIGNFTQEINSQTGQILNR